MSDKEIVDLYWARSEDAIFETSQKYGKLCHSIALNILRNNEDAQECVNDTYFNAWNAMPNNRPNKLMAFLAKITRNLALNKYKYKSTQARGSGSTSLALDELSECVSDELTTDTVIEKIVFGELMDRFLAELSEENKNIFILRYWFLYSTSEIAKLNHIKDNKVRTALHRMRVRLKDILEREGLY